MPRDFSPQLHRSVLLVFLALLPLQFVVGVETSSGEICPGPLPLPLEFVGGVELFPDLFPQSVQTCKLATMARSEGWRALVVGGTGAIGKYLVAELLCHEKFTAVTVIGRREIAFPSDKQPSEDQMAKLRYQKVDDLDEIASLQPSQLTPSEYDVAFCALGTTRKDAGSATAFRKIDYDGVVDFGKLAKQAQVQHLQLMSSMGANKNSFLLYPKTKGESEEFYRSLAVKQLSIFRPGLLDRGESARTVEKWAKIVLPSVKVGDVAKAMVRQAEIVLQSDKHGEELLDSKAIKNLYVTAS